MPLPETNSVIESYCKGSLRRMLTEELWIASYSDYAVPDARPWWKKRLSKIRLWFYWKTLGRFRNWLHRDCGDY